MIGLALVGVLGGLIAGMLGVGGGVVFVPALVLFAGLDQHGAEATSLLAIIPVAIVGTWRQDRYGNVRRRAALQMSLLAAVGAFAGVQIADALAGAPCATRSRCCCCSPRRSWCARALQDAAASPVRVRGDQLDLVVYGSR